MRSHCVKGNRPAPVSDALPQRGYANTQPPRTDTRQVVHSTPQLPWQPTSELLLETTEIIIIHAGNKHEIRTMDLSIHSSMLFLLHHVYTMKSVVLMVYLKQLMFMFDIRVGHRQCDCSRTTLGANSLEVNCDFKQITDKSHTSQGSKPDRKHTVIYL